MKKLSLKLFIFGILALTCNPVFSQNTPSILITNVQEKGETILIEYIIQNAYTEDVFEITPEANISSSSKKLSVNTLSGDYGPMISGYNTKQIVWYYGKDNVYLDENVDIKLKANISKDLSLINSRKLFINSLVFPGSGLNQLEKKPAYLSYGFLGYATFTGFIIMRKKSRNAFDSYNTETNSGEREDLYASYESSKSKSRFFAISVPKPPIPAINTFDSFRVS